jgi:hypothetical protein
MASVNQGTTVYVGVADKQVTSAGNLSKPDQSNGLYGYSSSNPSFIYALDVDRGATSTTIEESAGLPIPPSGTTPSMASLIQFTQSSTTGGVGQSVIGFSTGVVVSMTDGSGGGSGGSTYAWSIVGWPGDLPSAPTITNPTSQTATLTPTMDGVYVMKLIRTDPGPVVNVDVRFFAIGDSDYGFAIPSAGMTGSISNIAGSAAAQNAGWQGSAAASTNVFLDGLLRFVRSAVGRFLGPPLTVNFSSAGASTVTIVDGTDKPWRTLNLTGAGLYTEQIANTSPVPTLGKRFKYKINLTAGSGGFALLNGVGGSTILALSAPPSGTFTYTAEVGFDGTNWVLQTVGRSDPLAIPTFVELSLVEGVQTVSTTTFTRIGNRQIDATKYPANAQATFNATILTSNVLVAATIQLFNVTDNTVVTSSPVFPAASKLYEVQLKMGSTSATDVVTCSYALRGPAQDGVHVRHGCRHV